MADRRSAAPHGGANRNVTALLVLLAAVVVLYLVAMLVLASLLEDATGVLPRDRIWKFAIYWVVFMAPVPPALWGGALLARALVRPFNRHLVYTLATGVLMVVTVVFCLSLLVGGGVRGMILAILGLATSAFGWMALRRALVRRAP